MTVEVLYDDAYMIAISKPSGVIAVPCQSAPRYQVCLHIDKRMHIMCTIIHYIHSHERSWYKSGTAVHLAAEYLNSLGEGEGSPDVIRYGAVHHLDKEVSGIVMVAKNKPTSKALASIFSSKRASRTYIALLHGQFRDPYSPHPSKTGSESVLRWPLLRKASGKAVWVLIPPVHLTVHLTPYIIYHFLVAGYCNHSSRTGKGKGGVYTSECVDFECDV